MGVHGLTALLRRYAPGSLRTVSALSLSHQSIAFDASCHLNKFVYGDEPHPCRHIYGFYSMARFCQLVGIKPIFVFDGSIRIKAKEYEQARRDRQRKKVLHSLSYERDRSQRLALWADMADSYKDISDAAAARILDELGDTLDELEETTTNIFKKRQQEQLQHSSDQDIEQHVKDDVAAEERIEHKLALIARELRTAMARADDAERYTSTVRNLSKQEHQIMSSLVRERIHSASNVLRHVKDANMHMLGSLGRSRVLLDERA
ncbi:hypothetical protein K492DRAFT_156175 [Lichtheimia hyalospora FSU 10163]|nr:hypothetical protein K492DRAFT_156175 [Lichtheimia hyalospora FSU 10163]